MARAAKLKVYRTAIGFHDAYVAAPSQKAALAAWGSDKDLFARGAAELVTDKALAAEPLASPGKVIRRLRGTAEEQLAALPPDEPKPQRFDPPEEPERRRAKPAKPKPKPKPKPRPGRSALDEAERAVSEAEERYASDEAELRRQEQALARERRTLETRHAGDVRALTAARERAEAEYRSALESWRDEVGPQER